MHNFYGSYRTHLEAKLQEVEKSTKRSLETWLLVLALAMQSPNFQNFSGPLTAS